MRDKITILFLFLCIPILCHGQKGKLFTVDRELSSSMINSIYQDRKGIIWIATEDGLNRYDGSKFTAYRHQEKNDFSLMNDYTRILFEDRLQHFFVGTLTGLQLYDRTTERFTTVSMDFSSGPNINANISTIIERKRGDVLIGTSGHGVFLLNPEEKEIKARQMPDLLPAFFVNQLHEDRNGTLWAITGDKGIYRITKDKQSTNYPNGKDFIWPSCICEDNRGNIYIGCLKKGLFKYDVRTDKFIHIDYNPLSELPIKTLKLISEDEIYIGTDGNGMKIYNIQKQAIEENPVIATAFDSNKAKVHSILKDRQGNIWLGFFQKGVMILPTVTNGFKYIGYKSSTHNSIGSACIMSVCQSHDGTVWVGTDNDGIYGIYPNGDKKLHFAQTTDKAHSVSPTIMSICEDSDRRLWIGSYRDGLARLNPQSGRCDYIHLPDKNGQNAQSIYCMVEDGNKHLWIGSMGAGLFRMNLDTKEVFRYPTLANGLEYRIEVNMLHNAWINCLLHARNGKLYIGTYDGLGCLDIATDDFVSTYKTNRLLAGYVVSALFEDADGGIWIGTTQGLKHLTPKNADMQEFTVEDGLSGNSVAAIKEDSAGNLWISTNFGISRLNPKTKVFVNFYAGDGLQGNEFSKGAALISRQKEMIFGGTNGITHFTPARINDNDKKPEIRIADFYIHDKAVRAGMKSGGHDIVTTSVTDAEEFRLSYKDNSFSIEFSAMEFYNPERISYTYTFNNSTWVGLQPGINRVSFSDLMPGTYLFRVKAKDYNNYSETKEIRIIISPPWYDSWWAKSLYILITVIIIGLVALQIRQRYRTRQAMQRHIHAEQLNEAKLQFFINISHEIRTPMSLIISPLQKLIETDTDKERQRNYGLIYRNAERILQLVNQLMDVRKIDKGQMLLRFRETEIVGFVQDIYHTFEHLASTKHIELNFHSEVEELTAFIDPKNFDKIIMNILSNAFKYTAEGGKIEIDLHIGENPEAPSTALRHYFEIVVRDSGIGIKENEEKHIFDRFYQIQNSQNKSNMGTGIGLHLTRSLVELHHGAIEVRNNSNAPGCSFMIRLPLGKAHLSESEIEETLAEPIHHTDTPVTVLTYSEAEKSDGKVTKTKHRILLAEDDEEIQRYICRELSSDFHVQECTNGKEALALVHDRMPDLIISDVMMPEMDGMTLCRKVKSNIHLNHIPVILLTAKNREEDNIEGLSIGADAYITKPFNIEIVRQTAFNLIKNREVLKNNFLGNQEQEKHIQTPELESPDERLLNRVMKVINEQLGNPDLNVEMIAETVGISRVHLHRKLKELTNQTTRDLIRNVRLKQAATLLTGKKHSINEVAAMTGFTNVAYFSTAFKELYGMPPSTYMEKNLE
ncbi:hybrid sensor histidine kinase/response regulator transcription factor [Bacteroides zoogleoformans]|uniref:hybrid sensor histidine kinase/response regulator transcription factor n=1 Tax=Bacteroides zoogleoformans TaxID=28119 RepID=UPI00248EDF04|nr:two-component regulator propeller domain-containing protein [Bacteroides zoogleoformans]